MGKYFGVASFTFDIPVANTPVPLRDAGFAQLVELPRTCQAFRVKAPSTNVGSLMVGRANMVIGGPFRGETLAAGQAFNFEINPKTASVSTEFDLSAIFVMSDQPNDKFILTIISLVD